MPKLKPDTQKARREHILDAAERCFARLGFHGATTQEICREAGISPGGLYVHFASKEDLIAGLTERDRAELTDELAKAARAPDLVVALEKLAERYTIEESCHKKRLWIEIGCEAMRGGRVSEIYRACDAAVHAEFTALFERARAEGKIAPALDSATLARTICVLGDGLSWRRGIDPAFDVATIVPVIMGLVASLLNPTSEGASAGLPRAEPSAHGAGTLNGNLVKGGTSP